MRKLVGVFFFLSFLFTTLGTASAAPEPVSVPVVQEAAANCTGTVSLISSSGAFQGATRCVDYKYHTMRIAVYENGAYIAGKTTSYVSQGGWDWHYLSVTRSCVSSGGRTYTVRMYVDNVNVAVASKTLYVNC